MAEIPLLNRQRLNDCRKRDNNQITAGFLEIAYQSQAQLKEEYERILKRAVDAERLLMLAELSGMPSGGEHLKKLLEELAPSEPIDNPDFGGCVWCYGGANEPYGHATREGGAAHHSPDCPWLKTRQLLGDTFEDNPDGA